MSGSQLEPIDITDDIVNSTVGWPVARRSELSERVRVAVIRDWNWLLFTDVLQNTVVTS